VYSQATAGACPRTYCSHSLLAMASAARDSSRPLTFAPGMAIPAPFPPLADANRVVQEAGKRSFRTAATPIQNSTNKQS